MINRVIFILSIVGVCIAIYVLQSFLTNSSIVCVNQGCEVVRKSVYSKILGIPVPTFGLVGYALLVILSFLRTIKDKKEYLVAMLGISTFGVLFVGWFSYMEVFVIKAICTWCALSGINMGVIFTLILLSFIKGKKNEANK